MPLLTLDERFNILEQMNGNTDSKISTLENMCSKLLDRIINLERRNTDLKNKTDDIISDLMKQTDDIKKDTDHMDTLDTQVAQTFEHITSADNMLKDLDTAVRDHEVHFHSSKARIDDLIQKHESL